MNTSFFPYGHILFGVFCLAALIQLGYYWGMFSRLAFYKRTVKIPEHLPPVSVIICAKNEDDNIVQYLPSILQQDYPDFQV
ncbi:MAG TPA: hypothetical protein VNZ86_09780, partial [Bacteroidia bacterium]|nr:hypothetical protein [Bacteroidia bacterium]